MKIFAYNSKNYIITKLFNYIYYLFLNLWTLSIKLINISEFATLKLIKKNTGIYSSSLNRDIISSSSKYSSAEV